MTINLISRPLIAAWIIVMMVLVISSGMAVYQSFLWPVSLRDRIINPRYNSVPQIVRRTDWLREKNWKGETGGYSHKRSLRVDKSYFWKAVDPGAPQVLRGDGDCALRSVLLSALRLRAPARLDGAPRWPTAPLLRRLYVHS